MHYKQKLLGGGIDDNNKIWHLLFTQRQEKIETSDHITFIIC